MITVESKEYRMLLEQLALFDRISEDDRALVINSFKITQAQKGEILIRQGSLVNRLYFVNSGFVRSFFLNENGEEFTTSLAEAGKMMSSFEGFQKGVKATEAVQAVTDCELLVVSKSDYDRLFRTIRQWPRFCSGIYESAILTAGERLLDMQRLSAAARYEKLVAQRPEIAMNIPVKYLASYLGMQPQSLSRIRAKRK